MLSLIQPLSTVTMDMQVFPRLATYVSPHSQLFSFFIEVAALAASDTQKIHLRTPHALRQVHHMYLPNELDKPRTALALIPFFNLLCTA